MDDEGLFQCHSDIEPSWFFHKSGDQNHAVLLNKSYKLNFSPVKLYHNGYYFCYGYKNSYNMSFIAKAQLKVYGKNHGMDQR